MFEVKAIIRPQQLASVQLALHAIAGMPGCTVSKVHAFSRPQPHETSGSVDASESEFVKVEIVVPAALADRVVQVIQQAATTNRPGDGMVFKIPVADAVRVQTGEHGAGAL
ncbi:MAG: P-II family nitrogen regulator [Gemmatimonadaceae bacterium]